jgi:hypothetical protein
MALSQYNSPTFPQTPWAPQEFLQNPCTAIVVSPDLHTALEAEPSWARTAPIVWEEREFLKLRAAIDLRLDALRHPYHRKQHCWDVEVRFIEIAYALSLSEADQQLGQVACLAHDLDHSGLLIRQKVSGLQYPSYSNEEFTCLGADQLSRDYLGTKQRLQLQGMYLATSHAQDKLDSSIGVDAAILRPYRPTTLLERALVLADVSACLREGFETSVNEGLLVLRERPAENFPASFPEWVDQQAEFVLQVKTRLESIPELKDSEYFDQAQAKFSELIPAFQALRDGTHTDFANTQREWLEVRQQVLG